MIRPKRRRFSRIFVTVLAFASLANSFAPAAPALAADCSDVYTPLSSFVVNGVNANKAAYVRVMNEIGVPWEMLAAIHYREVNFSHTNPQNGQGIFQFVNGEGGPYPPGPVSDEEFYRQLKFMATRLQNDYVWRGSVPRERRYMQPNEQNMAIVKDTLFSYNGRATVYANQAASLGYNPSLQPYEGSPYVMNRFDCPRARMGIITKDYGSMDGIDTRYGAFTIFSRLRGDTYWRDLSYQLVIADNGDPRQYVMYRGIKQLVPNTDVKAAWGLQNVSLTTVAGSQIADTPSGPALDTVFRINGGSTLYMADNGKRYAIGTPEMLVAWGLNGKVISDVSIGLGFTPDDGGALTFTARKTGASSIYMLDGLNGASQPVLRQYQNADVLMGIEGATPKVIDVSATLFDKLDNAIGGSLGSTKAAFGGQEYQMIAGQRMPQSIGIAPLYPGVATSISQTTFNRLLPAPQATALVRSNTSPNVYLLDNGTKRLITNPDLLASWTPLGQHVNIVNDGFVNLIPAAASVNTYVASGTSNFVIAGGSKVTVPANLNSAYTNNANGTQPLSANLEALYPNIATATTIVKSDKSPRMYVLDNSGRLHGLSSPAEAQAWGAPTTTPVTVLHASIVGTFAIDSDAQVFVSDGTSEFIVSGGQKFTLTTALKDNWGLNGKTAQLFSDGTLSGLVSGGQLQNKAKDAQGYYLIRDGKAFYTVDSNIAGVWGIQDATANYSPLFNSVVPVHMLGRFVISSTDSAQYVIDGGNWYTLSAAHQANFATAGQHKITLSPNNAPSTPTAWSSTIVKGPNSSWFIIDAGGKRTFNHPVILNHWTNNQNLNAPTASQAFLNLLPTKGAIERAVKGNGPQVYSAENATKRWITSPSTYNQQFAPFAQVDDSLINALPDGANIQ